MEPEQKQGGIYHALEEKYYAFMDFLEQKLHLPVYKYFVDPLESRGIPSFPVFVLLIFLLLALLYFLFFAGSSQGFEGRLLVTVLDDKSKPVEGALVSVYFNDEEVDSGQTYDDGVIPFTGLQPIVYTVKASKTGYSPGQSAVDLLASGSVTVSIKCVSSSCSGTPTVTPSVPTVRPTPPAVSPTPPPEEDAAYLAVTVLDANSESVDAIVYVYNAFSDLLISTIEADDGSGVLGTELTAGTRLYFTAEADGYAPFDGTDEPVFEVEEGWNAYTIRMQLLNESSNYTQSTITVLDENATGLP
ncbi:MAG: carboxypeptidase-like regulatory domain-containing protein, partial [Candidatus Micrarchaeota archaeon]